MHNNKSLSKSAIKLSKINKMDDNGFPSLPQIQKYDTNKLFEEFKRHLLRQDKKQNIKTTVISNQYKNLLCELTKKKQSTKIKKQNIQTRLHATFKPTKSHLASSPHIQRKYFQQPLTHVTNQKEIKKIQSNSSLDNCKFKLLRPQTSESKFRITSGKNNLIRNESVQNTIGQICNNYMFTKEQDKNQNQDIQQLSLQRSRQVQISLQQISSSVLMIQVQQSRLHEQIHSLKQSLNKLKKQVDTVNKQLQVQNRNQQKYKHILYLATSIQNQTDYVRVQNLKGYYGMASRQDETIVQMKKFKSNLRKQKDQMETVYIEDINQWAKSQQQKIAAKKRQFLFSATNTPQNQQNNIPTQGNNNNQLSIQHRNQPSQYKNQPSQQKNKTQQQKSTQIQNSKVKISKKQIDQLDILIQLLKSSQKDYQEIKQQQCSKVRLGKINKSLISRKHVQILERIEQFQQKFDMKIGSIQNLVLKIYHIIFDQNQHLEQECIKITKIKQDFQEEYRQLIQSLKVNNYVSVQQIHLQSEQKNKQTKINRFVKNNSNIFLKIIDVLYMLLFKFRYMFSIALTLDVDKKSFRDCVIQVDSTFSSGLFFTFNYEKHLLTSSQRHDIINENGFKQILLEKQLSKYFVDQATQILFNDHRVGLIIHRSWIQSKLKEIQSQSVSEQDILDIIETIRQDCQEIYKSKLPSLASLFLTCIKSISMSKYQMKLAASSNQRGSIFLPVGPTKKINCFQYDKQINESYEKQSQRTYYEPSKKNIQLTDSLIQNEQKIFQKNPRKIINHLESIKNKSLRKFKLLNFSCQGKAYKYNEGIVIPDFPLIVDEQ